MAQGREIIAGALNRGSAAAQVKSAPQRCRDSRTGWPVQTGLALDAATALP
ncbi:hypothetical protein [Novosphingobium beihaiensis]|uniref:Uncharacterized protein n=1 Tax=Novosphingobium beihaiensis TaxID=2930389 RepID=A0ABT0BTY5_9SPHN|nr:hypothetical protein [Novosphingobium beihaiensis]MCJ2188518.1 hypothetical protein [Novosphingobium beihaiensis]